MATTKETVTTTRYRFVYILCCCHDDVKQ